MGDGLRPKSVASGEFLTQLCPCISDKSQETIERHHVKRADPPSRSLPRTTHPNLGFEGQISRSTGRGTRLHRDDGDRMGPRRGGTMIGVSVVFAYDGDFDRSRVREVAKNARKMFEDLPGLRFKVFTLDEKQQRAMNFYVWDSQEAAEAFFTEELRERVTGLYGVSPTISFFEIVELVDNS
jgi:heme-degrading monooxygenase HmoA